MSKPWMENLAGIFMDPVRRKSYDHSDRYWLCKCGSATPRGREHSFPWSDVRACKTREEIIELFETNYAISMVRCEKHPGAS